jgi:plasmid maintenance system killer protein
MIGSFRHKGIEKFFLTGSKAGIQPSHAAKLKDQLTVLNAATKPEQAIASIDCEPCRSLGCERKWKLAAYVSV